MVFLELQKDIKIKICNKTDHEKKWQITNYMLIKL